MTTVEFEELPDAKSFKSVNPSRIERPTGGTNIKANINVNINTGKITITDENGKIKFDFKNLKIAKKWADAVK